MPRTWPAHYLDGRSAARHSVTIQPMRSGLHITAADGRTFVWPYAETRQTQGAHEGDPLRLEHGDDISEVLVITDPAFLTVLRQTAPELTSHLQGPLQRAARRRLTLLAAVGTVVMTVLLYFWGVPALAAFLTPLIPVSWEQRLGATVTDQLAPLGERCTDPRRTTVIHSIVERLSAAAPDRQYEITLFVRNAPIPNAFAAPGGYVVVFRGLLEATERPEQLAGILAHEFQHIYRRHTTRSIIEHTSTSLLLAAVAGDFSGGVAYGAAAAHTIGMLRYSREHEREADVEGMRLMARAGIDPRGMVEAFEILKRSVGDVPESLTYLSSHPNTQARIDYLEQLAARTPIPKRPLLPGVDWKDIRSLCQGAPSAPSAKPSSVLPAPN